MQVKLKVLRGKSAGKEIAVTGQTFVIGRGQECQLRPQSDAISRRHCEISITPDGVLVSDLGSKNGTWINGERLEPSGKLSDGDELRVGRLEFQVVVADEAMAAETVKDAATTRTTESSMDGHGHHRLARGR